MDWLCRGSFRRRWRDCHICRSSFCRRWSGGHFLRRLREPRRQNFDQQVNQPVRCGAIGIELRVIARDFERRQTGLRGKDSQSLEGRAPAQTAWAGKICRGEFFAGNDVHIEVEHEFVLCCVDAFQRSPGRSRASRGFHFRRRMLP